jgi:hypothetical protein
MMCSEVGTAVRAGEGMQFIDYESDNFPTAILTNGMRPLSVTWDDVLWAAVTVGRPGILHVFRYGEASFYEAMFRWSMVRMALQQRGPRGQRLVRTDVLKQMDPTEKGAINYFIGLLVCKLFASRLLDCPWTLHLDVFRSELSPKLIGGRSRPDMVAQSVSWLAWHAFECKGRASVPSGPEKDKAKKQAERLVSVKGTNCILHIGAITFFRNDTLEFFWRDPEPHRGQPIAIPDPEPFWGAYYSPFVEVYRRFAGTTPGPPDAGTMVAIDELDLSIGMHPAVASLLLARDWQRARTVAREHSEEFASHEYEPDGPIIASSKL